MEPTINERFIKLSSRLPFPEDIELGNDLTITFGNNEHTTFILNCVKTEDMDNQDGTINRIYTLKYLGE
jgi:hypothetical protein